MPFLYCNLLASNNIPAFQLLTTHHDASWLVTMMQMFNRDVQTCIDGRSVTVRYVIDFSFRLNRQSSGQHVHEHRQNVHTADAAYGDDQ